MGKLSFLAGQDILHMNQWTRAQLETFVEVTAQMHHQQQKITLDRKVMASCFFEPSTRTRLSFESAMHRLGGQVIGFSQSNTTSLEKGESLSDTLRVIGAYADVLVCRHPESGSARLAADATETPVINAGDGSHQHPTQSLTDLYTIYQCHGRLDHLHIGMMGDLKYGRTAHSLIDTCRLFNMHLHFIQLPGLELPPEYVTPLKHHGVPYTEHQDVREILESLDILYVTRVQKERLEHATDAHAYLEEQRITRTLLNRHARPHCRVLHPLPRVNEIATDVDDTPFCGYFQQAANGVPVRQALLAGVLGKV